MVVILRTFLSLAVAPVRERGLKFTLRLAVIVLLIGRSREGAWIEILSMVGLLAFVMVAPVRERGLKSIRVVLIKIDTIVAPVRERGLKYGTWLDFRFC